MNRMSIKIATNAWRGIAALGVAGRGGYLWEDVDCWWRIRKLPATVGSFARMTYLLLEWREFRNVFDMRLRQQRTSFVARGLFRVLWPLEPTLHISTEDIGPRMFVEHGFATIISAKSIGSDLWVNQQVTIGWNYDKAPVLGNGVRIAAGAKVIGGVRLGDNCIVGANGVVTKDIPSEEIWGGVPASRIGVNREHKLFESGS